VCLSTLQGAELQVLLNRSSEQVWALCDHADLSSKFAWRNLLVVSSGQIDGAAAGFVEPIEQP